MRDEFVPPKPKEFDRKEPISFSTVVCAIFREAVVSSGLLKLILGATKEWFIIRVE